MRQIGKVLVVFLLWLLALGVSSAQEQAGFDISLDYASPQTNLFFIDPGFLDVSSARGIAGILVNPASLASVNRGEVGIAGGLTRRVSIPFELNLIEEGESEVFPEGVTMPFTLGLVERGGIDYFGAAYRMGSLVFGAALIRGESYGVNLNLDGEVEQDFSYLIEDTLTNADHPDIPEEDTIPLTWNIEGTGTLTFRGSGRATASITPAAVFGAGVDFGPLQVGLAMSAIRYKGDADLLLKVGAEGEALLVRVDTTASGWTVNAEVNGSVEQDTVLLNNFEGNIYGNQFALALGVLGTLGFLDLGMGLESSFPFVVKGDYVNTLLYPAGLPRRVDVDTSGVIVDSINREISGEMTIRFSDFELDDTTRSDEGRFRLGGKTGIRLGMGVNLLALRLGLGGGVDLFHSGASNVGTYYISGTGAVKISPLTLRAGVVSRWQYLQFEDIAVALPFATTLGLGTSIDVSPVTIDLALRMNLLSAALKAMESVQSGEKIRPLSATNFGAGVRYRF